MSREHSLREKSEFVGQWWLPEDPRSSIAGTLICGGEGGDSQTLRLIGAFDQPRHELIHRPLIHGISTRQQEITLYRSIQTRGASPFNDVTDTTYVANYAFIGAHLETPESIVFDRASFWLSDLDEWADLGGFDIRWKDDLSSVSIDYTRPERVPCFDDGDLRVELGTGRWGPEQTYVQTRAEVGHRTYFSLTWARPQPVDEVLRQIGSLGGFIELATLQPQTPDFIRLRLPRDSTDDTDALQRGVDLLYATTSPERKDARAYDMLFTLGKVKDRITALFQRWIRDSQEMRPVHDLYFGTKANSAMYVSHRFLSAVQGLEAFHRKTSVRDPDEDEAHGIRVTRILESVPESEKAWLEEALRYTGGPSLRRRLKELVEDYGDPVSDLVGGKRFLNHVVATRNYLTHFDEGANPTRFTETAELYYASERLLILLHVCLLARLGFDGEAVTAMLAESRHFRSTRDWLKQLDE